MSRRLLPSLDRLMDWLFMAVFTALKLAISCATGILCTNRQAVHAVVIKINQLLVYSDGVDCATQNAANTARVCVGEIQTVLNIGICVPLVLVRCTKGRLCVVHRKVG